MIDANAIGVFHSGAPDTEREAALAQYAKSGTDRRKVYEAIKTAGGLGLTDSETATLTGLYLYTAAPRRNELKQMGLVKDSGNRRRTPNGKRAIAWVLA